MSKYNHFDFEYELVRSPVKGLSAEDMKCLLEKSARMAGKENPGYIAAELVKYACDRLTDNLYQIHKEHIIDIFGEFDEKNSIPG